MGRNGGSGTGSTSDAQRRTGAKGRGIAFALAMLVATSATAADYVADTIRETNAILFNEKVLKGALSDIAKMPEAELRAFTRYLSVCKPLGNLMDDPTCSEVQTSYSIEFGARRPLDDLINSMISRDSLDRFRIAHGAKDDVLNDDWIYRQPYITIEVEEAASARFRALRSGKGGPRSPVDAPSRSGLGVVRGHVGRRRATLAPVSTTWRAK
jgi:hypothetical protein